MDYIDLIPSKDIKNYLKEINYKVDMDTAFYLTVMFSEDGKDKKYLEQIINTFQDEPHTYVSVEGKDVKSTYHTMIKNYMKSFDLKENEISSEDIPDVWLHFPYLVYNFPVPFKDGEILCYAYEKESPIFIRKLIDSDRNEFDDCNNKDDMSFINSYVSYKILEDGRLYKTIIERDRENRENGGYLNFEYYKGNFDKKYKIIKELSDAYKIGKLNEELSKYNIEKKGNGIIYSLK